MTQQIAEIELGESARRLFPIFERVHQVRGTRLSYLDSAASSQKLEIAISTLSDFYQAHYANIHRGAYALSAEATERYEQARASVARFIGVKNLRNIIFTRGTTESINLACYALEGRFRPGDAVVLSLLEHHSNFVPWQLLAKRSGVALHFADITENAQINVDDLRAKIVDLKPKVVALTQLSNAFGSVTPLEKIVPEIKKVGALLLVDGAQGVVHGSTDVTQMGCDFYAFSGHKAYGPTGIGALYASDRALELMEPFQGGGSMISSVSVDGSEWAEAPHKFEAGTPAIAEAISLGATLDAITAIGTKRILEHELRVFEQAVELLRQVQGVRLYGPAGGAGRGNSTEQASIIAFNVDGIHPHDLSTVVDSENVQIRAGHHCAMPALKRSGLQATARASIGMYTSIDDFHALREGISKAKKMFC